MLLANIHSLIPYAKMKILITSALPYINGVKHLGNLAGSILPADVIARFYRQIGHEVLFICATDEHGTPAEIAAAKEGLPVSEYCERQHKIQSSIYKKFYISFDEFGRSSSFENHELTQHFYNALNQQGLIEERSIEQLFSIDDQRYLPDRYVVGTCPYCGYENARGDQCENCTRVLDPTDLLDPRSEVSGSTNIELKTTKHLYLKQSELVDSISDWIDRNSHWPTLVKSTARKWLNEGLKDRGITRDLSWGVPVNQPGFENKVFYVWFDAPIAYISTTKAWAKNSNVSNDKWKQWWYDAKDVKYLQFLAKDNIPFHTISFPATLIGSNEPWKLVDELKGFNWLNYYGSKFSTSQNRGIFTDDAIKELPADYWRYWLIANSPEGSDATFTFRLFAEQCNKDLSNNLGNFINRSLKFCENNFGNTVPAGGTPGPLEQALAENLEQFIADYRGNLEKLEFRKATSALRAIWTEGNVYLTSAEPWKEIHHDVKRTECIVRTSLNLCKIIGILSWPIIPWTAERILDGFGVEGNTPPWCSYNFKETLFENSPSREFKSVSQLFKKIDDARIDEFERKYGVPAELQKTEA